MYGCGGNMIGVCYFVLWNSMCRKQRLCEICNILCRTVQFFAYLVRDLRQVDCAA